MICRTRESSRNRTQDAVHLQGALGMKERKEKKKTKEECSFGEIRLNKEKQKKQTCLMRKERECLPSFFVFEFKTSVQLTRKEKANNSACPQQTNKNFHLFIAIHPVNLSILFTGGKEIKRDTLSNGE
jgi:hypothetical protein